MSNSQNPKQPSQSILTNVTAETITTRDITQVYKTIVNLESIPKPKGFPQNIPSSTDKFVGRERELKNLYQQLQRDNQVEIEAVVEGMGGVGKTELAIQYSLLHLHLNTYSGGICWLRAREQDIGLQIVNFARIDLDLNPPDDLELPDKVRWCWKRWQEKNTLIVFDDVKNYSKIKPYLPPQPSQFKVLITTRLKLNLASSLYLEVLSELEAIELLKQLIGSEKVEQELETAKQLCQRLGYLPLALQLVGRYVKERGISLGEERQRLEGKGLAHPSLRVPEEDPAWTSDIKRGVAAAFELSWEELNEPVQELGCLLSLFALAPIPWSLLERAAAEQDSEELENSRIKLEKLHLLQREDNYQLHQLIQEFFRNKQNNLPNADEQKYNFCKAIVEIAQQIPMTLTLSAITTLTPFMPHIAEAAKNYLKWLRDEDLIFPFIGLGDFYGGQRGAYAQAFPWGEQCVAVARKRLGEEHPDVATSLNYLAALYDSQGRYSEAEPLYLQALELRKRLLGEEHPDVATSLNYLAVLYDNQGRYSEAEPLYLQALELRKRLLGEEHPDVAQSLNNLAFLNRELGRYSEAEPLYLQALELYKRVLPEEHPNVALSLNNLALLYESQGRYSEAEPLCQQALELKVRVLGEEHPTVANSLNNLANFYKSQGRYSEAEPLCQQALELRKRVLPEEHPDVAQSLNNLAELYRSQGRYKEAEPLYLQALELKVRVLGEEHPDVATSLNDLALLYKSQGRYSEAEPLFQQALEQRKRVLGEEHPYVATTLNNLAGLYHDLRRYEEAESLLQQALEQRKRVLGEEHPEVAKFLNDLAGLYRSQGRYEEAELMYQKALEIAEKALGKNHPNTNTIRRNYEYLKNKNDR